MMLKVNGEYLDFNGSIEIEKKIKLFEDIETTDGDVSFAFELELTSHNIKTLRIPFPDSRSKRVYNVQGTEVLNNEGLRINKGSIRIESIRGRIASCSFFGGNSNWFSAISGNLSDLDLSKYDRQLSYTEILDSWSETEGIVFPIIDTGTLITRGENYLVVEDFVGCMFVHTLMKEVFKNSDIKINGELIDDPFYKSLIVCTNTRNNQGITDRTSYVEKNVSQAIPNDPPGPPVIVTWQNDSVAPFFDGAKDNFSLLLNRYTADVKMTVRIDFSSSISFFAGSDTVFIILRKNIAAYEIDTIESDAPLSEKSFSKSYIMDMEAGDYLSFYISSDSLSNSDILNARVRVTPIFIYYSYGSSSVPLWTKQQFVSNIFRLFNCISSYDSISKTLTINYFDKIKQKQSIDLSEYLQVDTIDYTEFIGNYAKQNVFNYQEGSDEELAEYNVSSFIKYGSGVIEADNDFIEQTAEVVESDFSSPISYRNTAFDGSLERINFVEYDEVETRDINSVSDDSGIARFNITDADDYFEVDDVVKIVSDVSTYNGEFIVNTVTSTYIKMTNLTYVSDATGTATKVDHKITSDDSVYIMSVTKITPSTDLFGTGNFLFNGLSQSNAMLAFFNLLRLGNPVEENYKQGLSFGGINSPFQYQKTLLDSYWRQFDNIVNDPVMCKAIGHMPWRVYNSLDFLSPVIIKTLETSNLYYVNRITGYQNSYTPCEVELIKLP